MDCIYYVRIVHLVIALFTFLNAFPITGTSKNSFLRFLELYRNSWRVSIHLLYIFATLKIYWIHSLIWNWAGTTWQSKQRLNFSSHPHIGQLKIKCWNNINNASLLCWAIKKTNAMVKIIISDLQLSQKNYTTSHPVCFIETESTSQYNSNLSRNFLFLQLLSMYSIIHLYTDSEQLNSWEFISFIFIHFK